MTPDDEPIAAGGLYHHVGLLDKEPRFKIYENWLALIYTIPAMRRHGYGTMLCNYIHECSKKIGVKEMYLYTNTAGMFYQKFGWNALERLSIEERNIVEMKKNL